ncbi:hypothetical protein MSIBF_A2290002 [groundwater metagenome]|uniref:Uncharacterized protein n=1 Tax=groundwater metagenome TaxID=717931 RepID=A0A098EA79_9ZZZZ
MSITINIKFYVFSQNFRVKCKNLVFCTRKVEIYNLIYPVLLRGYRLSLKFNSNYLIIKIIKGLKRFKKCRGGRVR